MLMGDKILSLILNKPMNYWDLLYKTNILVRDFIDALYELKNKGYINYENNIIYLTKQGRDYIIEKGIKPFISHKCMHCGGRTINLSTVPRDILERYFKIQTNRPQSISAVDQGFVTPEVTLARSFFLQEKRDIEDSSLIFIGDDDLTSIAIALIGNYKQITVLDIDKRLIDFINETVREENLKNFEAYVYNIKDELPDNFKEKYDIFFTDPLETVPGFTSFVNRGIQSLKGKDCVGYFNLTYLEASLKKWYLFEKSIIEAGFIITDVLEKFNIYNLPVIEKGKGYKVIDSAPFEVSAPDRLWYNSSLFRIYSVEKPKLIDIYYNSLKDEKELYLDEDGYVVSI
ncbi:MAG TPA: bis-aminopropyl spermidine synthase family protein [Caldisericia bacterium]|nr:bis-aminopropyl spermidine synthase family protein [Caldisericia bacterium]